MGQARGIPGIRCLPPAGNCHLEDNFESRPLLHCGAAGDTKAGEAKRGRPAWAGTGRFA